MSDALGIAVGGLNKSLASVTQRTANVVNASLTINSSPEKSTVPTENGDATDLTTNLVGIKVDSVTYAANAKVISIAQKMQKTLLDTIA